MRSATQEFATSLGYPALQRDPSGVRINRPCHVSELTRIAEGPVRPSSAGLGFFRFEKRLFRFGETKEEKKLPGAIFHFGPPPQNEKDGRPPAGAGRAGAELARRRGRRGAPTNAGERQEVPRSAPPSSSSSSSSSSSIIIVIIIVIVIIIIITTTIIIIIIVIIINIIIIRGFWLRAKPAIARGAC